MSKWYLKTESGKQLLVYEENDPLAVLDNVTVSMLINNEIPCLIPCSFFQMDQTRFVKFSISSNLNAFTEFIERPTSFAVASNLLINTCNCLIELRKYMIDLNSLVLDTDRLFIDMSIPVIMFVVDPVLNESRQIDLRSFFTDIVISLNMAGSDRRYVGDILAFLKSKNFSLEKFVECMESLRQSGSSGASEPEAVYARSSVPAYSDSSVSSVPENVSQIQYSSSYGTEQGSYQQQSQPEKEAESGGWKSKLLNKIISKKSDKAEKPEKPAKPEKSSKKSKMSSGLSGLAIPGQDIPFSNNESASGYDIPAAPAKKNSTVEPDTSALERGNYVPQPVRVPARENEEYVAPIVKGVVDSDTTLIMDGYAEGTPRLIRHFNQEVIDIDKDTFNLGRDPKALLDYVINDARVSRKHASILTKNDAFYIVDRGSRNHTYLNGKVLMPNEEIPLSSGDVIKLGSEEFTFEI